VALLYDAVAAGMWVYSRAAFRLAVVGPERLELGPGTLVIVTHRRETDVPLVGPPLYRRAALWRAREPLERLSFAARDDLFLPGFFAGFPAALPLAARRALFPVGIGRWLAGIEGHPLRSATTARLGELLRERRSEPLAGLVSTQDLVAFQQRASTCGHPRPERADDVLRGVYSDLLWRPASSGERGTGDGAFWARRAAQAAGDFRALVELLQAGGRLVVFPEGRPSPEGEIGPLERGLEALIRRGRPAALLPVGLAYDPLARGRTRVVVALGRPVPPRVDPLALLRRTVPLTAGQIVAAGVPVTNALGEACAEGRPVDPDLLDPAPRERRLTEARREASRRPEELTFLAREFWSARD